MPRFGNEVLRPPALLLTLLVLCGGCAANTAVPEGDDHLFLLGGRIDVDNRFASTVLVTPDGPLGMCSGMLIAPRLVLTAGHCVCMKRKAIGNRDSANLVIDATDCSATATVTTVLYESTRGRSARREPASVRTVAQRPQSYSGKVRPHPELKILLGERNPREHVVSTRADLAVILLDEPVEGSFPEVSLATSQAQPDESLVLVGYGLDKTEEGEGVAGFRRFGRNTVTYAEGEFVTLGQPGTHTYQGDSGGPCLRESDKGHWLVGISSRGTGKVSRFTSTHAYRAWLIEQIQSARRTAP
ncbi:trypsin-like serine protease [Hyalangium rubrum]|uniref:Trypsin-like serine protease n=1 Tax=Hyalangium rubrum TaxID=3103134 RepID=A0ABU5HD03_9BACT|nr:trypsin-like serine protease [Hyalangium sp. s54d21]MDY7231351.1 trypsin-like serine protease [Hyalangium sp. s54d21]